VLLLPQWAWERIVAHCLDALPLEACGLVAGVVEVTPGMGAGGLARSDGDAEQHILGSVAVVREVYPATNTSRSARLYTVEPLDLLRADRAAEAAGLTLIGVWHSHTNTPAYPSPTDVAQAPDAEWHYLLVSLSDTEPVLRSYRIADGRAVEEEVLTGPL